MTDFAEEVSAEPDEAKEPQSEEDAEILKDARRHYQACVDAETENRLAALDDLAFLSGGEAQWDAPAVQARKADGRPIITVNTLPTYLHQVTNDQRMNSPSIKVHPVDDGADIETAKVRQGMIRHIEYDSNADVAQDRAVNSAAAIGFGFWRLVTEYESEQSFNQKIMYKSVRNALSVRIDPLSTEPDGSDMTYGFVEEKIARDDFKRDYPKADANNKALIVGDYALWLMDTEVLVCDYYRIEKEKAEVVQLSNGDSGYLEDLVPNGDEKKLPEGLTVQNRRPGYRCKTMLYKITAVDVLERTEIKCKWIPIFPVYGDEIDIEGKVIRSGIIRHAKGPCKMYNVMITTATEEVSLRSKNPYMMAEGQEEGHEDEFEQANQRAFPYLTYKPITLDGTMAPPPQRQPMAEVPVGMLAMAMHARDNVKATTGLFDSSLGAKGTATSGIQEREQQQQGDMANFHYQDGLMRTLRHCGRCIDYMIPHYYDTERTIRILGEDDTADYATINQPSVEKDENGNAKVDEQGNAIATVLHDMTGGEYDITVAAGANYSTQRQENAEFFAKAMTAAKDPGTAAVVTYLAMKNQDAPGAEEATAMLKTLLPPQAAAVLEIKDENKQPDIQTPKGPLPVAQVPQVLAQLEGELQQCKEELQKADGAKQQADAVRAQESLVKAQAAAVDQQNAPQRMAVQSKELEAKLADAEARRADAEVKRIQAQADLVRAQAEAAVLPQQLQVEAMTKEVELLNARKAAVEPPEEPEAKAVTAEEVAKIVQSIERPLPKSLTIKAPSGQVYEVAVH